MQFRPTGDIKAQYRQAQDCQGHRLTGRYVISLSLQSLRGTTRPDSEPDLGSGSVLTDGLIGDILISRYQLEVL